MIKGMTHDADGVLNNVIKYRGKISTGYEPNEAPNTRNSPMACGFYRMMKEVVKNQRIGTSQEIVAVKDWILNKEVQAELEKSNGNNPQPKRLEICSLYKTSEEMWESCLAKFSKTDGLLCKSHGLNTVAKQLVKGPNGERKWENRFADQGGCPFRDCPDFKSGDCKQLGLLKCFPVVDLNPNPYRFETRSINTIVGVESTFANLETLLKAAHMVKQMEAGNQLSYDGLFGAKLFLVHRKVKSGGRTVFISDLLATPEFTESIMEPIKRGLAQRSKLSKMIGAAGTMSMLGEASEKFLEASKAALIEDATIDGPVPISIDEQRDVAIQFGSDDGDIDNSEIVDGVITEHETDLSDVVKQKATEALMNDGVSKE